MKNKKRYEILTGLPAYGPMYIPVTENGKPFYSEGFPVRFYKSDGTDWVANFEPGYTDLKQIIELENTQYLLVIAFGICYLVDPNEIKPISVFGQSFNNVFKASKNRFILTDTTDLTIMNADGTYWQSERISFDGLKDIKVENNLVIGVAYNPVNDGDEWIPFFYDIDTRILIGGSYNRYRDEKPWWKFW